MQLLFYWLCDTQPQAYQFFKLWNYILFNTKQQFTFSLLCHNAPHVFVTYPATISLRHYAITSFFFTFPVTHLFMPTFICILLTLFVTNVYTYFCIYVYSCIAINHLWTIIYKQCNHSNKWFMADKQQFT